MDMETDMETDMNIEFAMEIDMEMEMGMRHAKCKTQNANSANSPHTCEQIPNTHPGFSNTHPGSPTHAFGGLTLPVLFNYD